MKGRKDKNGKDWSGLGKKKIMIVDNEKEIVEKLKVFFERNINYEVLGLTDSRETLSKVHSFRPDVIILDLLMPHLGGLEVCEQLNDDEIGRATPIIITSALCKNIDKLKAFKLGIVSYFVKPIELEMLIVAIKNALSFKEKLDEQTFKN